MGEYKGSELVDFGFAHNTPMDKRKVKLAGNAAQDGGILFAWAALCGQEADTATVEENVERLRQVLHRHKWPEDGVLIVRDRAMLNSRLAVLYDGQKKQRLYYLSGLEPRAKEHKELLAEMSLPELRAHYLLGKRGHRYPQDSQSVGVSNGPSPSPTRTRRQEKRSKSRTQRLSCSVNHPAACCGVVYLVPARVDIALVHLLSSLMQSWPCPSLRSQRSRCHQLGQALVQPNDVQHGALAPTPHRQTSFPCAGNSRRR